MNGGNSEAELRRIESALARIEAVVRHRDVVAGEWEERHERLRGVVGRSLEQLDELIAAQSEAPEDSPESAGSASANSAGVRGDAE